MSSSGPRPLAGTHAIVTGASRGIGKAIAMRYAEAGAHVHCAARTSDDLREVVAAIERAGGSAAAHELDVTDEASVEAVFGELASTGGLDLAVLNAGVAAPAALTADLPLDAWRSTFEVNVFGVVACARAAVPLLRNAGGGKIIVTGSGTGHQTNARLGAYSASKAAVASLVRTLALELRADRIAVNELVPGPVATAMMGFPEGGDGEARESVVTQGTDEWMKQPDDVTDLALLIATMPNHGPSGQVFSLMGRLM